jgi:hypothetical protein
VMKNLVIFDGRNIINIENASKHGFSVVSIGKPPKYL